MGTRSCITLTFLGTTLLHLAHELLHSVRQYTRLETNLSGGDPTDSVAWGQTVVAHLRFGEEQRKLDVLLVDSLVSPILDELCNLGLGVVEGNERAENVGRPRAKGAEHDTVLYEMEEVVVDTREELRRCSALKVETDEALEMGAEGWRVVLLLGVDVLLVVEALFLSDVEESLQISLVAELIRLAENLVGSGVRERGEGQTETKKGVGDDSHGGIGFGGAHGERETLDGVLQDEEEEVLHARSAAR